jgi:hypothetical protein
MCRAACRVIKPIDPWPGPRHPQGPAFLATLQAPAARWKEAIGRQLIKDAKRVRANPYPNYDPYGTQRKQTDPKPPPARYRDWEDLSWARLALGAGWAPPSGTDAGVVGGRGACGAGGGQDEAMRRNRQRSLPAGYRSAAS